MKVFLHSLTATGHLNSTIGVGQLLMKNGHEVIFVIDVVLQEHLEKIGFKVKPLFLRNSDKKRSGNPAKEFAELFKSNGLFSNKSTYEKARLIFGDNDNSVFKSTTDEAIEHDGQIEAYILEEKPDAFICDHMLFYPCLGKNKLPWIKIISYQPLSLANNKDQYSPTFSGYSLEERDKFDDFNRMLETNFVKVLYDSQERLNDARDYRPSGNDYHFKFLTLLSPFLNIYQYPEELDYPEIRDSELPTFAVDAFVREESNQTFQLDPEFLPKESGQKLIYFSLGSMGGIDIELMKRLLSYLSHSPHKFIVSKGPFGHELELAPNMCGENNLPQTKVLPLVDLVITHGGNNTVCETFYYGKPMIVMGLFGDQFDNAQRVLETGFGLRLEPYDVNEHELLQAIESILENSELQQRMKDVSLRIQKDDKKLKLCNRIEQAIRDAKL